MYTTTRPCTFDPTDCEHHGSLAVGVQEKGQDPDGRVEDVLPLFGAPRVKRRQEGQVLHFVLFAVFGRMSIVLIVSFLSFFLIESRGLVFMVFVFVIVSHVSLFLTFCVR